MSSNALRGSFERTAPNMSLAKAVLALNAASAATVKTTGAVVTCINGITYSRAALAAAALVAMPSSLVPNALPFYTLPIGKTCYLLLVVNSAGTVYAIQSDFLGRELYAYGRIDKGLGNVPDVPDAIPTSTPLTDGFAPFGLIKVVATAATFLPGTDALDKASVTFTFYDISTVPAVNP